MTPAYIAGFLDGEGCFRIQRCRPGGYSPSVQVSNTYKPTLDKLHAKYGGSISFQKASLDRKHRPSYHWSTLGAKSLVVLNDVLPWLHEKREQAEMVLNAFKDHEKWARWTPDEKAKIEAVIVQLSEMKRRTH